MQMQSRQSGGAVAWFVLAVLVIAGLGYAAWRFAPEYLPGVVRMQLPLSPLDPLATASGDSAKPGITATANPATRDPNPPLYKWKDAKGSWNVTDRPPPDRAYETVRVNPDTNVVPAEPVPEPDSEN